jgi:hypothetical protein
MLIFIHIKNMIYWVSILSILSNFNPNLFSLVFIKKKKKNSSFLEKVARVRIRLSTYLVQCDTVYITYYEFVKYRSWVYIRYRRPTMRRIKPQSFFLVKFMEFIQYDTRILLIWISKCIIELRLLHHQ